MQPRDFVAEVYRRMSVVSGGGAAAEGDPASFWHGQEALREYLEVNYRGLLPSDRGARILDLGCGQGHFAVACREWGYADVTGADYADHATRLARLGVAAFLRVTSDVPALLADHGGAFDVIHAAHLIEHVPKHDLLENVDAMFGALRPGGRLLLETPNMLSPTAMHSLFVTLGHEYGFGESNLESLLRIGGFVDVRVTAVRSPRRRLRWKAAEALRAAYLLPLRFRNRLFGWSARHLSISILGIGVRPSVDPLAARRLVPVRGPAVDPAAG